MHKGPTLMASSKPPKGSSPKCHHCEAEASTSDHQWILEAHRPSLHISWKAENANSQRALNIMQWRLSFNMGTPETGQVRNLETSYPKASHLWAPREWHFSSLEQHYLNDKHNASHACNFKFSSSHVI